MPDYSKHIEDRYLFPDPPKQYDDHPRRIQTLVTVAVEGGADDYAVYRIPVMNSGRVFPYFESDGEPVTFAEVLKKAMDAGNKLTEDEAARLFPRMAERLAWRS